jgi:hypothetical protein
LITIDGRPLWFDTERQVKKFLRKRNRKDEPVTVIEEAPTLEAERLEAPSVEAVRKSLNRLADPVTQPVRPADDTARKRALRRRRAAAMLLLS